MRLIEGTYWSDWRAIAPVLVLLGRCSGRKGHGKCEHESFSTSSPRSNHAFNGRYEP